MKTKFYLAGGVCAASLAFCMPVNAQLSPATSPKATAPAAKQAARPLAFNGKITAVDQSAKTFTVGGKQGSRVFKVTENTTITKAGAGATLTDIVENERVRGTYLKNADGTLEAKTVKIGPKTEAEKQAGKSKKGAASPKP